MITECCSVSWMRSRTSRGVPEWSGGEDLYMGSHHMVTESVRGFIGIVPGPPGGSTCPGGPYGLNMEGNHPLSGLGAKTPWPGAAPPFSHTSSSSVALGEALPQNHELHHHRAVVLSEFSLNFSSPLAGSRRRRHPQAVHVLNVEAPSVRR